MASALIKSMSYGNKIISSDTNKEKLQKAEKELNIKTTNSNTELVNKSEAVFLCIKPKDIQTVLEEIRGIIGDKIIVSIAAGVKIKSIENIIGNDKKIIRVMPNLNCIVKEMAAAYSCNKNIMAKEKKMVGSLLNKAGVALEIEEEKLDAVTALSGSGPAFIAYLLDVFANAAEKEGLGKEDAYKLALQTFFGTSKLLKEIKMPPEELIARVATPGGTTAAGLNILENSEIDMIIAKAIEAAAKRSKELGK